MASCERGWMVLPTLTCPVLGICIGCNWMCLSSEEGDATCLGIFPHGSAARCRSDFFSACGGLRTPRHLDSHRHSDRHAGSIAVESSPWAGIRSRRCGHRSSQGFRRKAHVYYMHSMPRIPFVDDRRHGVRTAVQCSWRATTLRYAVPPGEEAVRRGATIIGNF